MTAAQPALAVSLGVRAWRHFFGQFELGPRLSLHPGARVDGDGVRPVGSPRAVEPAELALLDAASRPQAPALEVFTTPALLRERFGALDPDELPVEHAPPPERWAAFAADAVAFLDHVRAPLGRPFALVLDVRDPVEAPALLAGGPCRALLDGVPVAAPSATPVAAAHVNLGDDPAALVFWSLTIPQMASLLEADGLPPPADARTTVLAFVERFPDVPLVRLTLRPGEGVLVPFPGVAYDVDATGSPDLVITLVALPRP